MPGNDPSVHREHLRGRYAIITTVITLIGVILSALITAKFGPVTVNVNLDEYVRNYTASSSQNDEQETDDLSLQEQNSALQKEVSGLNNQISALNNEISDLNNEVSDLNDEVSALETENAALNELNITLQNEKTELEKQYEDLLNKSATEGVPAEPNSSATPPRSDTSAIKLTSLPVLGNNQGNSNYVYNSPQNTNDAISNLGDVFNSCISMRRNGNIDFYLNCEYQWLNAVICISEGTKNISNYSSTITIYKVEGNGDTEVLTTYYSSPSITMGFVPDEIEPIDVSDVEHLRITFYASGYYGDVPRIILGNPVLTPK